MFINIKNNEYENILGTCVQWIQKPFLQQTHQKIFARWNLFIIKNLILQSKHSKFVSYLERWVTGLLENSSLAQGNMDNIWQSLIFKMLTERIWVFFHKPMKRIGCTCTCCMDVLQVPRTFHKCWPIKSYVTNAYLTTLCVPSQREKKLCLVYGYRI